MQVTQSDDQSLLLETTVRFIEAELPLTEVLRDARDFGRRR